jgi:cytochrome c-type biogenesis protein CcmH
MAPDAAEVEDLRAMIAEAKSRAGEPPASASSEPAATASAEPAVTASPTSAAAPAEAAPVTEATTDAAPQPTRAVSVQVQLDPAVAANATPDDVVFVFARAAGGPPMPLAVQRLQVKELPASVTLDDTMGMTPGMNLAAFPEIVVVARVSKSGQATPHPGDLEGESAPLDTTQTRQVSISIDRVRP